MSRNKPSATHRLRNIIAPRRPTLRRLRDPLDPAAVRTYVPGAWPEIGGHGHIGPMLCWNDSALRKLCKPQIRVAVRVFACDGLSALARNAQIPLFKLSVTTDTTERCDRRLEPLNRDCYGATYKDGSTWKTQEGWSRWMIVPLPAVDGLSPDSPVTLHARGLDVLLPEGLSPEAFDKKLTNALGSARFDLWIDGEAGGKHAAALGLAMDGLRRFTSYDVGRAEPRRSRATELIVFKPRLHAGRLVGLIERLVHDAVVAAPACSSKV